MLLVDDAGARGETVVLAAELYFILSIFFLLLSSLVFGSLYRRRPIKAKGSHYSFDRDFSICVTTKATKASLQGTIHFVEKKAPLTLSTRGSGKKTSRTPTSGRRARRLRRLRRRKGTLGETKKEAGVSPYTSPYLCHHQKS